MQPSEHPCFHLRPHRVCLRWFARFVGSGAAGGRASTRPGHDRAHRSVQGARDRVLGVWCAADCLGCPTRIRGSLREGPVGIPNRLSGDSPGPGSASTPWTAQGVPRHARSGWGHRPQPTRWSCLEERGDGNAPSGSLFSACRPGRMGTRIAAKVDRGRLRRLCRGSRSAGRWTRARRPD